MEVTREADDVRSVLAALSFDVNKTAIQSRVEGPASAKFGIATAQADDCRSRCFAERPARRQLPSILCQVEARV